MNGCGKVTTYQRLWGSIASFVSGRTVFWFSIIITIPLYLISHFLGSEWQLYFVYVFPLFSILFYLFVNITNFNTKRRRKEYLEGYSSHFSSEKLIKNHYSIKNVLFWSVILLIVLIILTNLQPTFVNTTKANDYLIIVLKESFILAQIFFIYSILIALAAIIPTFYSDFKMFYAKQCCIIAIIKQDETEKAYYILQSINWYNKYIKQSLELQIKDRDKVFDKILEESHAENNCHINEIKNALDKSDLELVRVLSNKTNTKNDTNEKDIQSNPFLTEFTSFEKIRGLSEFIVPLVTVAVSIMALIYS